MDGQGKKGSSCSSERILPNYRLGKTLGFGSFGKVKLAQHVLTGHKVAIKILDRQTMDDTNAERVRREISMLRLFSHPHIVRLYEVVETRSKIYVVMEYMNCGELFYYVVENGRLQEDEARFFFQQIISGVECCHSKMVVHRDLKPENLLLDSKRNVKIADFGLGNVMRDGHFLKTSCGSPNYAAPEVVSGQLYAGPEVDVWSCGVILYAFLCGRLPFDDDNISSLYKKIRSGAYILPSHLSPGARDLIPRILLVDPMKRITIPEILQHPWFREQLPQYLAVPHIEAKQRVKKIDEEILQEIIKMGFNLFEVIESLQNGLQNEATVAYYLLLDNQSCVSSGSIENETQDTLEYMDHPGIYLKQQFPTEQKWALGFQSRASPHETMTEVLKALQNLNVCWKKIGSYNMKCRWLPAFYTYSGTTLHQPITLGTDRIGIRSRTAVKFEMQLYKAREGRYLLDLQMIQGPPFLFLEVCTAFLAQLQII